MLPISQLPHADEIHTLFTDIDDTMTDHGRLSSPTYEALWALYERGMHVVPVTGRPAGWCDHIARTWPVSGIIGENGAFYFYLNRQQNKLMSRFLLEPDERSELQSRLSALRTQILREVPGARVASDQPYRIHDLAIDFAEDIPRLPKTDIDRIVAIFEAAGATAKVSSIHVNGWFGDYSKVEMSRTFAHEQLSQDLDTPQGQRQSAYVGDSPNDEPAFAFFENAIGVANIQDFAATLKHPPKYVTHAQSGAGFVEVATHLLKNR